VGVNLIVATKKVKLGKFLVSLEGKNFLVLVDGGRAGRHGFFANAAVEAADENDAYQQAVALLRGETSLKRLVKNKPNDRPSLLLLDVQKIRSFRTQRQGLSPLVWYKEERRTRVKKKKPPQV
jgi:hypothetical protein